MHFVLGSHLIMTRGCDGGGHAVLVVYECSTGIVH